MTHPFYNLSDHLLPRLIWPLFALTVLLMVGMSAMGAALSTDAAPYGIVSFEFAGSVTNAGKILDSWAERDVIPVAAFIQGLDFLFLTVYSTALALGCVWASRVYQSRGWSLAVLAARLAWGQWAAAGLDAVENVALTALLFGGAASPFPQIAWVCAALKFTLISLGLVYVFIALAIRLSTPLNKIPTAP
jgi:hypothetical protein